MNIKPFHQNIESATLDNTNFRKVIYTAPHCQIVLMSIPVGEEIGLETHSANDQFFRIESGKGKAIVGGVEYVLEDGIALLVPSQTEHNIINTGDMPLKFYTIYSPAHHIDGRVHVSKQDAIADTEDEEFGNS
jgi:mannose-6-phosphate isomerase-like protein (cupin superfamily)